MSDFDFNFDDVIKVHSTKLNIPCGSNREKSSCSVQLSNKTDLLVAYRIWSLSPDRAVVSWDEDTYVGTILPKSTCFVTVNGLKETRISSLYISAFPVKDGVKAGDITKQNLDAKTFLSRGFFELPVVYYNLRAANSCSAAVAEKNQKKSLLADDDNNVGSDSSVKRRLSNKISSIILFSDQEIKAATNGLSDSSKIGQGGYGAVYKCILHGTEVAIKMLDPNSAQGIDEFLRGMEVLGRMRHPNLVKLIGACIQLRALIYEFLPHGSLGDCLQKNPEILTWQIHTRIVYEICSALTFLHSIKPQPVVHGDLKPANILLGANFSSKLADFGLCRFIPEGSTTLAFLDTQPKGTFGYIDPKFMRTGILTTGCDLYSFGVTILRLLTGTDAIGIGEKVRTAYKERSLMTMVDPTAGQWPVDVSELLAYFGLKCFAKRKSPELMQEIAGDLEKILAENGMNVVSANMTNNELTVVGSVDPLKIPRYVGSKTEKKVDLMSLQPTKKNEESSGPQKAQSDSKNEKDGDNSPAPTSVCLKITLHCDGCIQKIQKIILRFKGVESVSVVSEKDLVTVKGTMNMKELVPYLEERLKRAVVVVAGEKKDDSGNDKNGNGIAGGEKKEKDGDGDIREKEKRGDAGDKKEAATEVNKMDYPLKISEYVGSKTGKKVDLMSLQPTKKNEESSGPQKTQSDSKNEKKDGDISPASTSVCLKITLHSDGCIQKIRKVILKFEGVESVSVVSEKDLVTVKGTMDMKELVPYLEEKLKRAVVVVADEKKDDSSSEKNGNGNGEGEKKEKDGDSDTREKGKEGDGGDKKEAATEVNKMENIYYPRYPPYYYPRYPRYHTPVDMEIFSDENPNACSVM